MAHTLNDKETEHIADLIKIHISQNDIPKFTAQLNTVLEAIPVLDELVTDGVPEASQTHGLKNILREDVAVKGLDIHKYPNTQNLQHTSFVVKKVL